MAEGTGAGGECGNIAGGGIRTGALSGADAVRCDAVLRYLTCRRPVGSGQPGGQDYAGGYHYRYHYHHHHH